MGSSKSASRVNGGWSVSRAIRVEPSSLSPVPRRKFSAWPSEQVEVHDLRRTLARRRKGVEVAPEDVELLASPDSPVPSDLTLLGRFRRATLAARDVGPSQMDDVNIRPPRLHILRDNAAMAVIRLIFATQQASTIEFRGS